MSIIAEVAGFLKVFADGSVQRFAPEIASASAESFNGYKSKDVIIHTSKPITARIFLPYTTTTATPTATATATTLPILLYFHGGGFCIGSTAWLGYHYFLGDFSVASQSIVLSVDYRLAPENRLPVAFEDCYSSLEWLCQQVKSEPWLAQADISRVFLSGDSAGGNIAHHVAVRALKSKALDVKIQGLLLIHPYFGSEKRTQKEVADGVGEHVAMNDLFWRLSISEGSNRDYFGCNFETEEMCMEEWSQFPAVVVFVAGLDFLKERGIMYAEFLQNKGLKEVRVVEAEKESHVFHVFYPESEATRLLQRQMSEFMKSY